jgi:hypothetical protein
VRRFDRRVHAARILKKGLETTSVASNENLVEKSFYPDSKALLKGPLL